MDRESCNLLAQILAAPGICGREGSVREVLRRVVHPVADRTLVDDLGNLLVYTNSDSDGPHILLESHMDEIGFLVTGATKDGYVLMTPAGYIDDRVVPARPITIYASRGAEIPGIAVLRGRNEVSGGAGGVFVGRSTFAVDIGASSDIEVWDAGIGMGDQAVWGDGSVVLGRGRQICSKALDARIGCYAIAKVLMHLSETRLRCRLTAAFTVQEEIGRKGAIAAVARERPDAILVFDIMAASCPGYDPDMLPVRAGSGPGITIMQATTDPTDGDGAFIADRSLVALAKKTCREEAMPYQLDLHAASIPSFVSNAGVIYVLNGGVPTAQLCVGTKYMHSSSETASLADIDNLVRLMEGLVMRLARL